MHCHHLLLAHKEYNDVKKYEQWCKKQHYFLFWVATFWHLKSIIKDTPWYSLDPWGVLKWLYSDTNWLATTVGVFKVDAALGLIYNLTVFVKILLSCLSLTDTCQLKKLHCSNQCANITVEIFCTQQRTNSHCIAEMQGKALLFLEFSADVQ